MQDLTEISATNAADHDRRRWLVEIAAVIVVFVLPALALLLTSFATGTRSDETQATLSYVSGLMHCLSLIGFFAFLVWSSREELAAFGLRKPLMACGHPARDLVAGGFRCCTTPTRFWFTTWCR